MALRKHPLVKWSQEIPIGDHRLCAGGISPDAEADEIFEAISQLYVSWMSESEGHPSRLDLSMLARRRELRLEELARTLVEKWNSAGIGLPNGRFELWIGTEAENWFGLTNGAHPVNWMPVESVVRFVTYSETEEAKEAYFREEEERERARRRANPVLAPVNLPRNIASELARYLKLEFPELGAAPCSLTAKNLKLAADVIVDGVPTQYWLVPNSENRPLWGLVERFDDGYCLSHTQKPPAAPSSPEG